ncbi:hypothetical protein HZS_5842, partial [Henneguya salminicola]
CYNCTDVCNSIELTKNTDSNFDFSREKFQEICPFIIENALSQECQSVKHDSHTQLLINTHPVKAWLLGLSASFIINLCALNGFILIFLKDKNFFQPIMVFLLSMSVGVLIGNGMLHLLPNALDIDPKNNAVDFYKFITFLSAIYSFLIFEILLKTFVYWSRGVLIPDLSDPCCATPEFHTPHENAPESFQCKITVKNESKRNPFYKPVFLNPTVSSCALIILIGDFVHNFIDGLVIGSSFAESTRQGLIVTFAIFLEEFTHELGDFAILINSGMTFYQGLFWNGVASTSNFFGSMIGLYFGTNPNFIKYIEAYCGGMFLYIGLVVMLPEVILHVVKISKNSQKAYAINITTCLFGILFGLAIMA